MVTLLYGKINSEKHLEKCEHSYLAPTQIGIVKVRTQTNELLVITLSGEDFIITVPYLHLGFIVIYSAFQTLDEMKLEIKPIKIDRRLTGSSIIDEPLQQVGLVLFLLQPCVCFGPV